MSTIAFSTAEESPQNDSQLSWTMFGLGLGLYLAGHNWSLSTRSEWLVNVPCVS